ncbi:MAG: DUF4332 domain-containing protein [Cyanobacteriota bacterium]|nr:DUF4332 domain-containing protein [Cyanobacteriota bacterium]
MQTCNWAIAELPGLSLSDREKLQTCGITTTQQLLSETRTAKDKAAIAGQLHLHPQHLRKWIALADLAQLPSVGCQYCGVLLHSGIASIAQLAKTPVHRLHRQILRMEVSTMQRPDLCPSVDAVQQWVKEASLVVGH